MVPDLIEKLRGQGLQAELPNEHVAGFLRWAALDVPDFVLQSGLRTDIACYESRISWYAGVTYIQPLVNALDHATVQSAVEGIQELLNCEPKEFIGGSTAALRIEKARKNAGKGFEDRFGHVYWKDSTGELQDWDHVKSVIEACEAAHGRMPGDQPHKDENLLAAEKFVGLRLRQTISEAYAPHRRFAWNVLYNFVE